MNKDEIHTKYLALHSALGKPADALDKEAFDIAHRKVWHDCDVELKARKVELELKPTLSKVERDELVELESLVP